KPLSHIFAPFFFIYIGLLLNIETLFRKEVLWIVLIIIVVSFTGRIISGYLTGDPKLNKFIIGLGMTPIGEAGLIFAMFGKQNGIIDNTILSATVATLVIVSIITPLLIKIAISFKGINDES
ncbi:MAG: hypothetical protein E6Q89_06130, partial [Bacteroidia bacterium]